MTPDRTGQPRLTSSHHSCHSHPTPESVAPTLSIALLATALQRQPDPQETVLRESEPLALMSCLSHRRSPAFDRWADWGAPFTLIVDYTPLVQRRRWGMAY